MVRGVMAVDGVTIVTASTARQLNVDGVVYRPFAEPAPSGATLGSPRRRPRCPNPQTSVLAGGTSAIAPGTGGRPGVHRDT
jgi:hypothetical protein